MNGNCFIVWVYDWFRFIAYAHLPEWIDMPYAGNRSPDGTRIFFAPIEDER